MKLSTLPTASVLIFAATLNAQQTQILVDNDQIKAEVTKYSESCAALSTGNKDSHPQDSGRTCTELAITNKSRTPITAWVATTERDRPGAPRNPVTRGIRSSDSVPAGDSINHPFILRRDTHRVTMGDPTRVDFKAAVFLDGSVFGDPEWVKRIVQTRRNIYQDTVVALQKLRAARKAGTPREQLIQEFRELERQRGEQELETRPGSLNVMLTRVGVYDMVIATLQDEHGGSDAGALNRYIDRLESTLLEIGNRILISRPPITDHPVPVGEPLDSPPAAGHTGG
jgi:hypothetical protein